MFGLLEKHPFAGFIAAFIAYLLIVAALLAGGTWIVLTVWRAVMG